MYKKFLSITFIILFFVSSCGSFYVSPDQISTFPTLTQSTTISTPISSEFGGFLAFTQTSTPTPTSTMTQTSTSTPIIGVEITYTPLPSDALIPIPSNAQDVYYNYFSPFNTSNQDTVYYQVSASIEDLISFYLTELTQKGWSWVYTDTGSSVVSTVLSETLLMEFKKDQDKLGIAVISGGENYSIVFAGINMSGSYLATGFISGIAGGLDLTGPNKEDFVADTMLFSSEIIEFKHPSNWLPTDTFLETFNSGKDIYFIENVKSCKVNQNHCFVNFIGVSNSQFSIPVSVRIHYELSGISLEEADAFRWQELEVITPRQKVDFPEDFTIPNSLKTIEVKNIFLQNGTPAIQRIYQWEMYEVDEIMISTYTLFESAGLILEFHTDFSSKGWELEKDSINHVISGITVSP